RDAAEISLPGLAPAEAAPQSGVATQNYPGNPQNDGRDGVHRGGDTDADALDAGGRARLPGAEPCASRAVLCLAAIAADFQADPDDRRAGPVFPDREMFPRRGFARRPTAGDP